MGICKEATDATTLMLKSGRETKKREVTLVDKSNASVSGILFFNSFIGYIFKSLIKQYVFKS